MKPTRKKWSATEIKFLSDLYIVDGMGLSELYPIYIKSYCRTKTAVHLKIKKLKLQHTKKQTSDIKSRINTGTGNGMYGKVGWSLGRTKESCDILNENSKKISKSRLIQSKLGNLPDISGENNPMFGVIPFNKNKTNIELFGTQKAKLISDMISNGQVNFWKNINIDEKNKRIDLLNKARIHHNIKTSIEVKMENFLIDNNILYEYNKKIGRFYVDFYLPLYKLVIECDGDYWHANPILYNDIKLDETQISNKSRDNRKNLLLNERHISFIRIWEHDINNNFNEVKNKIWELLIRKI